MKDKVLQKERNDRSQIRIRPISLFWCITTM